MMSVRLKGTVINMKTLSQHIDNPIIVGGGDSDGRYLTIIFTQEAAARFAPNTQVYLSWRHIQTDVKGYNVFTEIPREDTETLVTEAIETAKENYNKNEHIKAINITNKSEN